MITNRKTKEKTWIPD